MVQITHYTSSNYTDRPQVNIHCIENFFTVHDFCATCACPENNRVTLKIFTVVNILFIFRIFEQLALALKNRVSPEIFHGIEHIFYYSRFLSDLRLPWKTEFALKILTVLDIFFTTQDFWATCACPEKQRVSWIHSTEYIYFFNQDFWATSACPEKQSCPENFHCMEYTFYYSEFEQFALALKNRVSPGIFHCIEYEFLSFRIFKQLALALENRGCPEFTVLNIYFLLFRIFEQLALALENKVALDFFTVLK